MTDGDAVERAHQEAQDARDELIAYDDEEYLFSAWIGAGVSFEEAEAQVRDPAFLILCISALGLEVILKDWRATEGLFDALVKRDPEVMFALLEYVEVHRPKRKRGPKPKGKGGKYLKDQAAELKAQGKTGGQITRESCTATLRIGTGLQPFRTRLEGVEPRRLRLQTAPPSPTQTSNNFRLNTYSQ